VGQSARSPAGIVLDTGGLAGRIGREEIAVAWHDWTRRVEVPAKVLFIVVCAAVVGVTIHDTRLQAAKRQPPDPVEQFIYHAGDRVQVDGVDWAAAPHTLMLVVRAQCDFCQKSMPFYRRLLEATHGRADLRVVAASTDEPAALKAALAREGLTVDAVIHVKPNQLHVTGVPTVLLVDGDRVHQMWRGALGDAEERDVLKIVSETGSAVNQGGVR
jgi:peroxiredoxin